MRAEFHGLRFWRPLGLLRTCFLAWVASAISVSPLVASPALSPWALDFGAARWVELPVSQEEGRARALTVLDFDGDAVDDLVVLRTAASEGFELVVRLGNPAAVYPHHPGHFGKLAASEPFAGFEGPFSLPSTVSSTVPSGTPHLVAVDVDLDSRPDVVILDPSGQPIAWLRSGRRLEGVDPLAARPFIPGQLEKFPGVAEAIAARADPLVDVAELRLGAHAGGDLVAIADDGNVRFLPRARGGIFTVNSPDDGGDSYDQDGFCDTENNPTTQPPTPPSGICTLRAAIEQSNFNAGADTIHFAIGGGGAATIMVSGSALAITGPLTLDATTQAGFAGSPLIGLEFDGGGIFPGLSVAAGPTLIRGFTIGGFTAEGIAISADDVTVETCYLGTDAGGTVAHPNLRGIGMAGNGSTIGGAAVGAGNVISGNLASGVIVGGSGHIIEGNTIGTDVTGTMALGNGVFGVGVLVTAADSSVLGNLVSGHNSIGIRLEGDRNVVRANFVGTDVAGTSAIPNVFAGIYVVGANDCVIGGFLLPTSSNVVSGNTGDGIRVAGSSRVNVIGNLVGTDATGQLALGNTFNGIHVHNNISVPSTLVTVGAGPTFLGSFGNLVSANGQQGWHGIFIEGGSRQVTVEGNLIGVNLTGTAALGNVVDGVRVRESTNNDIGEVLANPFPGPNTIAFNGGAGIAIIDADSSAGSQNTNSNQITINRLFDNGGLGIDLTRGSDTLDGVTANDGGDGDFGPNRLQNFPSITLRSEPSPGVTRIEGTLSSAPNLLFDIRIFTSTHCHPSGFGEAKDHVGTVRVTTDGAGFAPFLFDAMTQVNVLTATATNVETRDTSELSSCGLPTSGRLGNRVWEDLDSDGLQGVDDPGIPGVIVNLWNGPGTVILDTTVTDLAGFYSFDGLATGMYRIGIVPSAEFLETLVNEGLDDAIDSDIDATFRTTAFPYTAGTFDLTWDAGLTSLIFADGFESGDVTAWSSAR